MVEGVVLAGMNPEAAQGLVGDGQLQRNRATLVPHGRRRLASLVLLVAAALCLAQALSKGVLWVAGERTSGTVVTQKKVASTRGAALVRYQFDARSGTSYAGSALTASRNALRTRVDVAYLGVFPRLNMPAYGPYSALLAGVWSLLGLIMFGLSRVVRRKLDDLDDVPEDSGAQTARLQQADGQAEHRQ